MTMAVTGKMRFPVFMRVGEATPERQIGALVVDVPEGAADARLWRPQLAAMLRAVADELDRPSCDCDGPGGGGT
jgi:hypothetical protein